MKKLSILVALLATVATTALAETLSGTIQWSCGPGVYWSGTSYTDDTEFAHVDTDGILVNHDVLWQLIHTTDGVAHNPVFTNPDYLDEMESLVTSDSYRLGNASYFDSQFGLDVSLWKENPSDLTTPLSLDESVASYYVYQRIYELDKGVTVPTASSPRWDSDVVDIRSQYDGVVNQATTELAYKNGEYLMAPIHASVPEPATMSLLGLGALAMVLRRKLRK